MSRIIILTGPSASPHRSQGPELLHGIASNCNDAQDSSASRGTARNCRPSEVGKSDHRTFWIGECRSAALLPEAGERLL